jgi:HD-GYP domain-containing protein (c-di-GMP phosphodiesterase class II)
MKSVAMARLLLLLMFIDAMRSNRSYKAAVPRQDAFSFLINNVGTHFDSELMNIFKHTYDGQIV